jgi:predicted lipoprotein with Yx(FWY)xxD motif
VSQRRTTRTLAAGLLVAWLLAACGAPAGPGAAPGSSPTVQVGTFAQGHVLVDAKGFTLYTYTADSPGKPDCDKACLALWPPLLANGTPTQAGGLPGALGVVTNLLGQKQVTYRGLPLYTFVHDKKPGDETGQGFKDSLGVWIVATP